MSLLIASGEDVVFVSRQLGHANPAITLKVYAHLWDEHRHADALAAKLEASYGPMLGNLMETADGAQPPEPAVEPLAEVVDLQALRH